MSFNDEYMFTGKGGSNIHAQNNDAELNVYLKEDNINCVSVELSLVTERGTVSFSELWPEDLIELGIWLQETCAKIIKARI